MLGILEVTIQSCALIKKSNDGQDWELQERFIILTYYWLEINIRVLKNTNINIQTNSHSNLVSVSFPELKISAVWERVSRNSSSHMTNAVTKGFPVVSPTENHGPYWNGNSFIFSFWLQRMQESQFKALGEEVFSLLLLKGSQGDCLHSEMGFLCRPRIALLFSLNQTVDGRLH